MTAKSELHRRVLDVEAEITALESKRDHLMDEVSAKEAKLKWEARSKWETIGLIVLALILVVGMPSCIERSVAASQPQGEECEG